ncbi:MAG: hypothetical protein GY795_02510, partial [Desulfobacterales bacterium]|nr:hypothetical protein [Desulfobacterales bacterium]
MRKMTFVKLLSMAMLAALALIPINVSAVETQELPSGVSSDWWGGVQENIRSSEYCISWQDITGIPGLDAAYQSPNRAHNLRTYYTPEGIRVIPRTENGMSWIWGLSLTGYGYEEGAGPVGSARLKPSENRMEYIRSGLTEWYLNDEKGLEQGFTLLSPPDPLSPFTSESSLLALEMTVSGTLTPHLKNSGEGLEFTTSGGVTVISFGSLHAYDAEGRDLPARFELKDSLLSILVDADGALWPVTVDPVATSEWTAESNQANAYFGWSAGTAGDVNNDGYADVIVGADYYDNGESNEGRAYVYHGSASGLSASPDWTAESNQAGASFGISVGTAGDVNNDGYADVIVGAYLYDNGESDEGRAFVYHGSASGLSASPDWTAESNQATAYFGYSVGTAGDVNNDGYADVIVGAKYYDNGESDEGGAFVYHGSASGLSATPDWTAESNQASAWFGISVGTAGDVNNDGYADVIVGAYQYDNGESNEGRAYVYHGSASGLSASPDWTAESNQVGASFGVSVGTAGDVNNDGYADVIVGAFYFDNGETDEGRAFVYYGSASGIDASEDWSAESNQAGAEFGCSMGTAGDVNNDGYADVIVGACNYDNGEADEGGAFVYHGSASGLNAAPDWSAESNQTSANFGRSVGTAGDVNNDGYADVIVGAFWYDNGEADEGRAYVYHGSASGLNAASDWTAESNQASAWFGNSVGTAGDVNNDGYADVIVGAPYFDNGEADEGGAYVYHGSASGLNAAPDWTAESNQASATFGCSAGTAGDVNNDGYADVIVGAIWYDNGEADEGRAYVYHGSASGLNAAPDCTAESNQASAWFGISAGTAGDVNNDGYADVIVGAYKYDNGETDEGAAFVWYGTGVAVKDSDGSLTPGTGVTEPVALPSTAASAVAAVNIFDFILTDGGTSDALSLDVTQVILSTSGTGDFTKVIWRLNGPDASDVTGVYSAPGNTITFSGLTISVADGTSETYTVNAYYSDNTLLTGGQTYILSTDGDTDLTVDGDKTQMSATVSINNSTGTTVDITGTSLVFATQPSDTLAVSNISGFTVGIQDAFGNTDTDSTASVTLSINSNPGSSTLSGTNPVSAVAGVTTFSSIILDKIGTGYTLDAASGVLVTGTSSTFNITTTAPVLDNSGTPALTGITEDIADGSNTGTLVSSVIASLNGSGITDSDPGQAEGIAVTAVDNTNGNWQFDPAGGTSWTNFSASLPSDSSATLLAPTANIRFVPNADYNGAPNITFRAWDQTFGTNGDTGADASANGGATPYSSAAETASVTVTPVNDAPVITGQNSVSVPEDTPLTVGLHHLLVTDPDNSYPTGFTLAVTDGTNYTRSGIVVTPVANFVGTLTVPVKVNDGSADSNTYSLSVSVSAVDDGPTVAGPISDLTANEDSADTVIGLSGVFTDIDSDDSAIVKSVVSNTNTGLVSANISGDTLTLDYQADQNGTASVTIRGTSDGKTADDTFTITVNAVDDAPTVANPVSDVTVNEDAADTVVNIGSVFTDTDSDDSAITKAVLSNSNPSLVSVSVNGNTLTLDYQENLNGTASVTVRGTSNGKTADDTFTVTVNSADDAPTVANPLSDVTVDEDAADTVVNLGAVFTDADSDDSAITKAVLSNSNPSLVSVSVNGNTLTLDYQENQNGTASITVRATSDGKGADSTFTVTVNAVDDAPSAANPVSGVTVDEDAADTVVNLGAVFTDIDNDDNAIAKSVLSNSNQSLVSATLSGNTLTLDYQE